ncbi:MAG: DUF3108 domain-containing protein [Thermodesulfobacteriota bacterium]
MTIIQSNCRSITVLVCLLIILSLRLSSGEASSRIEPLNVSLLDTVYQEQEKLFYEIAWTGGVKIGEMSIEIKKTGPERFVITGRVKDSGLFHLIYPVDDTFVTTIKGPRRLPIQYDVVQREGRDRHIVRKTYYRHKEGHVRYQKNIEPWRTFIISGPVHNEFSSFFYTRALSLERDHAFMVPTFADKKRNEVMVAVQERGCLEKTLFGTIRTVSVLPQMTFKGLYDKSGDTVIWFSDDRCRVPVKITSKIILGSLTATLVRYESTICPSSDNVEGAGCLKPQRASLLMGE